MATLVLTAVGTLLGGPIGGAIGALLGQQVDTRLFAPKGRQGPRLGDLRVQTSRYGEPLPKLFGTMRVAGTVIWATDLIEHRTRSGGGKGRPRVTSYTYSTSFAVALSGRAIRTVRRIWADGKLLRGEAGDWKSETGFRLHLGHEAQAADPLIAAAEGAGLAPAYRGVAYAVFEDMALADFGNRIPSLTFEVEADDGAVSIGRIAASLSAGALAGDTQAAVGGYAAIGDSMRGAIEALGAAFPLQIALRDGVPVLTDRVPADIAIPAAALGTRAGSERAARIAVERTAAGVLPDMVTIAYHDPARDYQAGLQRARRGAPGRRSLGIELPVALAAGAAKAAAERALTRSWAARRTATVRLPWRFVGIGPAAVVRVPGLAGRWRVSGRTIEHMVVELRLEAMAAGTIVGAGAAPGRATREPDAVAGETAIALIDLPPLGDAPETAPSIWVAAAGTGAGWRRAGLIVSRDDGASWDDIGTTADPAVIGHAMTVLPTGPATLFDRDGAVEIELLHGGMTLMSRDDDALIGGANLALLGEELIQFGSAVPIGGNRWRLSRLLRGRRATEWAIASHAEGERFVLIEEAALARIALPVAALGSTVRVIASGVGDPPGGIEQSRAAAGAGLRPPPPVALRAARLDDGTVRIAWIRRSRSGWAWLDGGDVPIGEASERYRVVITPATGATRTIETVSPTCDYSPADQAADGSATAASLAIAVRQIGDFAASEPAAAMTLIL